MLITLLKDEAPYQIWSKVEADDFEWWDAEKEADHIWTARKLKKALQLSKEIPLLEGMVFIKIIENGRAEVIPYTSQARAASQAIYGRVSQA